ncbi:phage major capsid protein [Erythrobacteraceae bacterium CFH 75059]|uniref:phage major capsid protein n=1 Tax=Qipengyuania thermophila TaxID=2509361 RepID=UPI001021CBF4|nr:phage major capsid protein [Qipengyuania thermophila]TCD04270.1 phage major capsid protein [Erythrobacteraceae bacterium CFH 75059]
MADFKELNETLKALSGDLERVNSDLTKKAEDAMSEVKNFGDMTQATKGEVDKLITSQTEVAGKVETLIARLEDVERKSERRGERADKPRSVGAQLIDNETVKGMKSSDLQAGQTINIPVKNALLSSGVAEGVVEPQRLPGIDQMPRQRLFIRDLIASGRTTSPAIFWVQQSGFVNNAAVVPEGVRKPESTITFDTKITPVVTIAHIFKASKQILDDFAQLQSTVDAEMRFGLAYAEEQEILFGAGGATNIEGIVPQASAYVPAFEPESRTRIDDIRLAILQAQLARLPSTGIVLHHMDWAGIELTKDSTGGYILANPLALAGPTLWGLPVVATEVPEFEGEFLVGAFSSGAQFFTREDANVVIATTNADDFEHNKITIRCEERGALAVKRPEAFVTGPFGAAVAP